MKSITSFQPSFNIHFTNLWNSPITKQMSGNMFIPWTTICMHETGGRVGWRSHFLICQYISNDSLHIRQHEDKQYILKQIWLELSTAFAAVLFPITNQGHSFLHWMFTAWFYAGHSSHSVCIVCLVYFSLLSMHHLSK